MIKVKEEREKSGLKLNIQKAKIMASSPITSWQIVGEKVETVKYLIFSGSKINVDGDCSHKIKRCLLLGRKAMTNLDSVLKSRDITLLINVHKFKAMVFPVVMHRCESWTIRKAIIVVLVTQSCLTLCDRMNYSPSGCSVHGVLQARILEWIAIPFSRGSSQPRDQTSVF